jgi:hypothetical protein
MDLLLLNGILGILLGEQLEEEEDVHGVLDDALRGEEVSHLCVEEGLLPHEVKLGLVSELKLLLELMSVV